MTHAHVTRPSIVLGAYPVTMDDICDDIARAHGDDPKIARNLRIARHTQVACRHFSRPLTDAVVGGDARITERNQAAFADSAALGVQAASRAIADAGLAPGDIDCVVSSHTTSWTVPGLDVHLVQNIDGMRPDVARMPMSTLGCAGGAQSLVKAAQFVRAHPGSRVLVVVAETLSTVYNHRDTSTESMIYKSLFGDSAGACVVSDTPLGPGLRIDSTWEYLLPSSQTRYSGRLDGAGLHFDSTKAAVAATSDVMPALTAYLAQRGLHTPDFAVIHPGGPRIIDDAARGLGLDQDTGLEDKQRIARHSWASLREEGNLGGVAVLSVLSRTHDDPPADGDRGVLVAFGPGFAAAACTATWNA
ncbi:PhlD [Streptomyces sp. NBC_01304]|uniref:PhlD n=1 Tax=Streptomyces sp. NBC_01304 TaxID=2903818 RepID=UPI002E15F265|nr:PhlD [Streptomyces sp. NBC_01304]